MMQTLSAEVERAIQREDARNGGVARLASVAQRIIQERTTVNDTTKVLFDALIGAGFCTHQR